MTHALKTVALVALASAGCVTESRSNLPLTSPGPLATATLSGIVFDSSRDEDGFPSPPVAFPRISYYVEGPEVGEGSMIGNADGGYLVPNLPYRNRVRIRADKDGYHQPCSTDSPMNADSRLDIEMVRNGGRALIRVSPTLSGLVFESGAEGRRPVPGQLVSYASNCKGLNGVYMPTGPDGRYDFCRIPLGAGCVSVVTSKNGESKNVRIEISGDTVLDFDIGSANP